MGAHDPCPDTLLGKHHWRFVGVRSNPDTGRQEMVLACIRCKVEDVRLYKTAEYGKRP